MAVLFGNGGGFITLFQFDHLQLQTKLGCLSSFQRWHATINLYSEFKHALDPRARQIMEEKLLV